MTEEDMRKGYWYSGEPIVKFVPTSLSGSEAMQNACKPSLEARLDWLEADISAQRTAILKVERRVVMLAGAVALACIVALAFKIALAVLT